MNKEWDSAAQAMEDWETIQALAERNGHDLWSFEEMENLYGRDAETNRANANQALTKRGAGPVAAQIQAVSPWSRLAWSAA